MPYIYSTLTADQDYALYPNEIDFKKIPKPLRVFRVYGGANVISKKMITPRGVATHIKAEDLKVLEKVKAFQKHIDGGFISVDAKDKAEDAEAVARNMERRDKSAQLEDEDFDPKKRPKLNESNDG